MFDTYRVIGRCVVAALLLGGAVGGVPCAVADTGPVIVIPGRPGVPVMMDGRDVSYAVVEGDWGLGKGNHPVPNVIYGWTVVPTAPTARYFPHTGRLPGYGRYEIDPGPQRELPPPAESYQRTWAIESQPTPATENPPYPPPQVNISPPDRYNQPPGMMPYPGSGPMRGHPPRY